MAQSKSVEGADVAADEPGVETKRSRERQDEEFKYRSVIVKRNDMDRRHADDIMELTIRAGTEQLERAPRSLALSSIAGGLMLTFSVMAVGVVESAVSGLSEPTRRLAIATVYPLGFILCILASMELFTEHTATAVYPVLDRRVRVSRLLRLWCVVLAGNLVGVTTGAGLLALGEPVIHARAGYIAIATDMLAHAPSSIFVSAVLAGCLMAMGAWLVHATPPGLAILATVSLVTFLIGLAGLHHSIAGAGELAIGLFLGARIRVEDVVSTIGVTAAGNLVGGSMVVALLNYGHVRQSQALDSRSKHGPTERVPGGR